MKTARDDGRLKEVRNFGRLLDGADLRKEKSKSEKSRAGED